jgi:type I restriction enzyme S subunit
VNNTEAAPWPKVDLGSLGKFRNGVNFKSSDKGTGLGLINVKDIFAGDPAIEFDTLDRVDLASRKGIERFFVKAGDLFFVRSSVKRDGVGLVSLARRSSNEIVHCGFVIRFRMTSPAADPLFLTYLLRSPYQRKTIIGMSGGSAITNISQDSLASLQIPLPPLPTQRKISAILSAYDDLIENNTRRIAILEDMAQAIYREWFVHFRFPGHEGVRMVESELGPVPEGWEVRRLGDVCTILMGQSPKSEFYNEIGEGLPFHQGVKDFGDRFPTDRVYCTLLKRIAEDGDILFSVRAPVGRINIANKKIVVGRGLCAIRNNTGIQNFTFHQLKEAFQEEDIIGGGTIFKSVTKDDMHSIRFLVPPKIIIERFEEIVTPMSAQIENLTTKNATLRQTRDLLLPRLISGELDVSELDIDTGAPDT